MNARSQLLSMAFIYAAMAVGMSSMPSNPHSTMTDDELRDYIRQHRESQKQRLLLNKDLKEYTIDGITVIALNEKNAIRKVNNAKKKLKL